MLRMLPLDLQEQWPLWSQNLKGTDFCLKSNVIRKSYCVFWAWHISPLLQQIYWRPAVISSCQKTQFELQMHWKLKNVNFGIFIHVLSDQLIKFCSTPCRCAILVVSHGDPLQILQTILHEANQHKEPADYDLASILKAVQVAPILSQHRKYSLLTGELRGVI